MMDLQELISRARFIFSGAPKRFEAFKLVNGKNSTKDIANKTGRSLSSVLQDLQKLKDLELIQEKRNDNAIIKKDGASIFIKNPLVKHISNSYFSDISDVKKFVKEKITKEGKIKSISPLHIPNEGEILDICKRGEDQHYEFKMPGIKMEDLSEEIAAFLHTKSGGFIFYGIDDSGTILGSDCIRQEFDQRIQNSIRNTITPHPNIEIHDKDVMGTKIILIMVPPWDKKSIYQFTKKQRYLIRKGTNKFALSPDELRKISKGEYVI